MLLLHVGETQHQMCNVSTFLSCLSAHVSPNNMKVLFFPKMQSIGPRPCHDVLGPTAQRHLPPSQSGDIGGERGLEVGERNFEAVKSGTLTSAVVSSLLILNHCRSQACKKLSWYGSLPFALQQETQCQELDWQQKIGIGVIALLVKGLSHVTPKLHHVFLCTLGIFALATKICNKIHTLQPFARVIFETEIIAMLLCISPNLLCFVSIFCYFQEKADIEPYLKAITERMAAN